VFLRAFDSCLHLLLHIPVLSVSPSIKCCRRHFLRKMRLIQVHTYINIVTASHIILSVSFIKTVQQNKEVLFLKSPEAHECTVRPNADLPNVSAVGTDFTGP